MRLPVELRLMIIRYLLPAVVDSVAKAVRCSKHAILKVNRQLNQEECTVLYGENCFKVEIIYGEVRFLGRNWTRHDNESGFPAAAKRIQAFEFEVNLGSPGEGANKFDADYTEEYEIYVLRGTIRKFLKMIVSSNDSSGVASIILKHLRIRMEAIDEYPWDNEQMFAAVALVIEPFCTQIVVKHPVLEDPALREDGTVHWKAKVDELIRYDKQFTILREQWMAAMQGPLHNDIHEGNASKVETMYGQIEDSLRLIQNHAGQNCGLCPKNPRMDEMFTRLEHPSHWALVAYENRDIDALRKIQEQIGKRWANGYRELPQSLQPIVDAIGSMDGTKSDSFRKRYPYALPPAQPIEVLSDPSYDSWYELIGVDTAPKIDEPSVTYEEELLRVCIQKDGKTWTRLKTPAMVRALRAVVRTSKG